MSQKKPLIGIVIVVSVICVILLVSLFGLMANTSSLNSQIQKKDSQIADLNSQIANLTNQINQISGTGSDLQSTINRLELSQNLSKQILNPMPYDTYSGNWLGTWVSVSTLQGTNNPTDTSEFQISSAYHLFRINITLTGSTGGNLQFAVVQDVGSQKIDNMIYSVTIDNAPTEKDTVYLFAETINTNSYHLTFQNYEEINSWTFQIEQLTQ
jgi:cell division protein FtsB